MRVYLERIAVTLPDLDTEFTAGFTAIIGGLGHLQARVLRLTRSSPRFYPELELRFRSGLAAPSTDFVLSDGEVMTVTIENTTGLCRASPHVYQPITVTTVRQRLANSGVKINGLDHVGFNLPWFSSDVHPTILHLRQMLAPCCLYHRFPTGEPWDFILPGDIAEIARHQPIDYTQTRRPKFELVSFPKTSTPLIQWDVSVNVGYDDFARLFPEALNDPDFRNIWLYLQTPYPIDVCLVLNESTDGDWGEFFQGHRL